MNIIYIDPVVHSPSSATYQYYNGVYDELCKIATCFLYKRAFYDINDVLNECSFEPDVVIFGLGGFNFKLFNKIKNIESVKSICILFKPQNNLKDKYDFCRINKIDLILSSLPWYTEIEKATGIKTKRFCFAADPEIFKPLDLSIIETVDYDIGFSGALHNSEYYVNGAFESTKDIRSRIYTLLQKVTLTQNSIKYFWNGSDSIEPRIKNYDDYVLKINKSRIWLATEAAFGDITPRFYEVSMCKTLLFCNTIPDSYKDIFQSDVNCVMFSNDLSNFMEKLHYYLNNWHISYKIIERAYNDFIKNHTWKNRAQQLIEYIKGI